MKIRDLIIQNFRSVENASIRFNTHNLLCGPNNIGKSTLLEAINLVLGPDRIGYPDAINEFDFHKYKYVDDDSEPIMIRIEVRLTELDEIQRRQFSSFLDYWDTEEDCYIERSSLAEKFDDKRFIQDCLRVHFEGQYSSEEDEFMTNTYFSYSPTEELKRLNKKEKRDIGFLYLRYLRTGNRALTLENGSLLDIIFHLKEIKFTSWEKMLQKIRGIGGEIREDGDFDEVLSTIELKLNKYILLKKGVDKPLQFEITNLTRKQLKDQINLFVGTLPTEFHVPFRNSGSGTVNILMFSLLNIISELKKNSGKNVIFAMEEPEIAIAPSTQRNLINELKKNSDQTIVTSHSPYVTEQFLENTIISLNIVENQLIGVQVGFNDFKEKRIKSGFRNLFSEGLLSVGIVAVEGISDKYALYAVSELLHQFDNNYQSLDLIGITVIDSGGSGDINKFGACFKKLTKKTFALYDKGKDADIDKSQFEITLEIPYNGIEDLLISELPNESIESFYYSYDLDNCQYIDHMLPMPKKVWQFLKKNKGTDYVSKLLFLSTDEKTLPPTLVKFLRDINQNVIS
jgi:putative ATP-dependent endonuclease of OLD family